MWELDYEEGWASKSWCFWTVVLEKTPKSPLDCQEIQPLHSKGNQSWVFIGKTDAKAYWNSNTLATSCKELTHWKNSDAGSDRGQEEKGMTKDEMAGWHHRLDGHEFEWILGVGDVQGDLVCCDSWGCKESGTSEWLNWTELRRVKGHETRNKAAVVPGSLIFYHQFWVYFTFCVLQKILFGLWNGWMLLAYNFIHFLDSLMLHEGSKASLDYDFQNSWCSKITGSNHLMYGLPNCYFILLNASFPISIPKWYP